MLNARLSQAFCTWFNNIQNLRRQEDILGKVLKRWTNQCLVSAFGSWHEHAVEQKRMVIVCSRIILRMVNGKLAMAFERWRDHGKKQRRMTNVCSKVLLKLINRSLGVAFATWKNRSTKQKKMRHVCKNIIKRMSRGVQAAAFASWRKHDRKAELQEEAVLMIQHQKYRSNCFFTFQKWCANAQVSKNVKANRRRALMDSPLDRMLFQKRPHLVRSRSWQGPIVESNQTLRRLLEIRALELGKTQNYQMLAGFLLCA